MVIRYEIHSEDSDISAFSHFDCKDSSYDCLYDILKKELLELCEFPKNIDIKGRTIICSKKDGMGITYLVYDNDNAVGYFPLASGSLSFDKRNFKDAYKNLIPLELTIWNTSTFPAIRITHLAVDKKYQGTYIDDEKGNRVKPADFIMRKIFDEIIFLSMNIGIRYIIVDALAVPKTISYYAKWDFMPLPRDNRLFDNLLSRSLSNNKDDDAVSMYLDLNRYKG